MPPRRNASTKPMSIEPLTKNTLSIDGQAYAALLYKLDDNNGCLPTESSRVYRRLDYAYPRLLLRIESSRDTAREIIVASRNLSQGGISILHATYMYPGTAVTVDLIRNDQTVRRTRGTVARCEHRGGIIHEIGVKFDQEINLREYLHSTPELLLHAHERIEPEQLDKSILFISKHNEFSPEVRQALLPTNLKYTFKNELDDILPLLEKLDIIVIHHANDLDAPDMIAELRAQGFDNPIIILAKPQSETQAHLLSACGADTLLPWPCEHNVLACAIAEFILNDWTYESLTLLRSCVTPETRKVLVSELATRGVKLDQHARKHDHKALLADCRAIVQLARPLNIEPIRKAAADIAARLSDPESDSIGDEINELSRACTAAAAAAAATGLQRKAA